MDVSRLMRSIVSVAEQVGPNLPEYAELLGYGVGECMHHAAILDVRKHMLAAGVDHLSGDGAEEVANMTATLYSKGFRRVGHGYFSIVLRHADAPGVVFKLSTRTDDAYAAYALWARDLKHPHAPKIHGILRGKNCIVFALQEYVPLHKSTMHYFSTWEFMTRTYNDRPNSVYRTELVKFMQRIEEFFKDAAQVDMHGDNCMYDPITRRIIITDPVSFTQSSQEGYYVD